MLADQSRKQLSSDPTSPRKRLIHLSAKLLILPIPTGLDRSIFQLLSPFEGVLPRASKSATKSKISSCNLKSQVNFSSDFSKSWVTFACNSQNQTCCDERIGKEASLSYWHGWSAILLAERLCSSMSGDLASYHSTTTGSIWHQESKRPLTTGKGTAAIIPKDREKYPAKHRSSPNFLWLIIVPWICNHHCPWQADHRE